MGTSNSPVLVKKFMTLQDLDAGDEKGPVFVKNMTNGDLQGQIIMSLPRRNGNGYDLIRIPRTFIPIDLTDQVARSQLLENGDFRRSVSRGLLRLMTPQYARWVLESPDAKEEAKRIKNDLDKAKAALSAANLSEMTTDEEEEYQDIGQAAARGKTDRAQAKQVTSNKEQDGVIVPKLKKIVSEAVEEEKTQTGIIADLRRYSNDGENWKIHELKWLMAKFKNQDKVFSFLKKARHALTEAA